MDFMPNKETIRIYKNTKKTCVCEKYKSLVVENFIYCADNISSDNK